MKPYNRRPVYSSKSKIKNLLPNGKDVEDSLAKSGIYSVTCQTDDCDNVYIGQTKRSVKIRASEHLGYVRRKEPSKSGLAEHILTNNHEINKESFKLIDAVDGFTRLNVLESLHIQRYADRTMNRECGSIRSSLFSLL